MEWSQHRWRSNQLCNVCPCLWRSMFSQLCKLCLKENICWQCWGVWERSSCDRKQLLCRWSIKVGWRSWYSKDPVRNVISMYWSGGFSLTKFIPNNKELLISIPEDKSRPGVKDLIYLEMCQLRRHQPSIGI